MNVVICSKHTPLPRRSYAIDVHRFPKPLHVYPIFREGLREPQRDLWAVSIGRQITSSIPLTIIWEPRK